MSVPDRVTTVNELLAERMRRILEASGMDGLDWRIDSARELPPDEVIVSSAKVWMEIDDLKEGQEGIVIALYIRDIFCRVLVRYISTIYLSQRKVLELARGIFRATGRDLPDSLSLAEGDEEGGGKTEEAREIFETASGCEGVTIPLVVSSDLAQGTQKPPSIEEIESDPALFRRILSAFTVSDGKKSSGAVLADVFGVGRARDWSGVVQWLDNKQRWLVRKGSSTVSQLNADGHTRLNELESLMNV